MKANILNVEISSSCAHSYPIIIGENLLSNLADYVEQYSNAKNFLVVTNKKVYDLYADKLNIPFSSVILEDGEEYKNFDSYKKILDSALESRLERSDAIIALGGGVIGDVAGFAAASYQRGVDFIQIPTTLLAQVDSSVGGKVAINHPLGKNMIGAFYQPKLVVSDTSTLKTLDERQYKTGLGEVLKYAFIERTCNAYDYGNKENLFEFLQNNKDKILTRDGETVNEMIRRCCILKAAVVNADEKEKGLRAILNFGHTFAHAIEKSTNYNRFTHGEAVSVGIKMALDLSLSQGLITTEYFDAGVALLDSYELDYSQEIKQCPELTIDNVFNACFYDKKVQDNKIRFILSNGIGEVGIFSDINDGKVREIIKKYVD